MSVNAADIHSDGEKKKKRIRILSRFNEPYWAGTVAQAVFIAGMLSMAVWGVTAGLAFLVFLMFITHVPPLIKLYLKRREIGDEKPDRAFELRFKDDLHAPADFEPEEAAERAKNPYFDNMVYLFHGTHYIMFFVALFVVASMESYLGAAIMALFLGMYYAPIAESYSHEFVHRRNLFQQMLGGSVWASYCYGTFLPEHCMGHHVHVSTPEDASSAPKDMTVYEFLPKAFARNAIAGFKLEAKRLRDRGQSPWSPRNRLIWLSLFSLSLAYFAWAIAGVYGIAFFIFQTIGGLMTIEVANYVMHYGLQRKQLENGRYERVSPLHSWNREGMTNLLVIGLMRHSDHHAFPRRPYQNLRNFPEAPELPLPYEVILYMPYFPKLWFKVMNPSVDKHMNKLAEWRENNVDDYKMVMGIDADRIKT